MPSKSVTAVSRLKQDYLKITRDPVPYIHTNPLPNNILEWHFVIVGPEDSPYDGGYYHGKLVFPGEYPFKPPTIYMITPSGRFQVNSRICTSFSDFHPETWNPAWTVSTILTGLLSFFTESSKSVGTIDTTEIVKRQCALDSIDFNLANPKFRDVFPDIAKFLRDKKNSGNSNPTPTKSKKDTNPLESSQLPFGVVNGFIAAGLGIFAYIVYNIFTNEI